jgi:hypothetical protein
MAIKIAIYATVQELVKLAMERGGSMVLPELDNFLAQIVILIVVAGAQVNVVLVKAPVKCMA